MNGLRGNLQKNFPATQNSSFGNLLFRGCVVYYLCSFLLSCFFCYLSFLVIFSFSTNYFSTPPGHLKTKKVLHTLRTANSRELDSTILSFSSLWPNCRYSLRRAASRTRQSAMPSPILSPPILFLRLAHPVGNNKNANQLLNRYTPVPRQLFQFQENPAI